MTSAEQPEHSVLRWISLFGSWNFTADGNAIFETPSSAARTVGLCLSQTKLSQGEVRATFRQLAGEVDGRIVIGYQPNEEYYAIGLGGYKKAYTLTHHTRGGGWREVVGVGTHQTLLPGKSYGLKVQISGRRLVLSVDEVPVIDTLIDQDILLGQIGLFSWGDGGAEFSKVSISRHADDIEHVVVLVHGIRTRARWQSMLHREFAQSGIEVAPTNYGYFDLLRFLLPVPLFRNAAIERVRNIVASVRLRYPNAQLSFIAHSFGTYVLAELMGRNADFRAHRIVFCGSVVRYDFPFRQMSNRFTAPIVNEVSARDPWPPLARNVTFGYGDVGASGFNDPYVRDRWHIGFGHSQYLTEGFCRKYWIPFFERGDIVAGEATEERPAWWCRGLHRLSNKYFLAAVAALLFYFLPYFLETPQSLSANQAACSPIRLSSPDSWRTENLLPDQGGSYYVIVESITTGTSLPTLNKGLAWLELQRLRRKFPTIDFDMFQSTAVDGSNAMWAILMARGLSDASQACAIMRMASACGIHPKAYVYRLHQGIYRGCGGGRS